MSEFVGFCKQQKIRVCITKTAREEGLGKLPEVINRYFDKARVWSPAIRENVYLKTRMRYLQLAGQTEFDVIQPDLTKVKNLYNSFLGNPELRARLVKLKEKKPKRSGLLPSDEDLRLLGEAKTLGGTNRLFFVTDDGDYLDFKNEIGKALGITVIELMNLRGFAQQLKESLSNKD